MHQYQVEQAPVVDQSRIDPVQWLANYNPTSLAFNHAKVVPRPPGQTHLELANHTIKTLSDAIKKSKDKLVGSSPDGRLTQEELTCGEIVIGAEYQTDKAYKFLEGEMIKALGPKEYDIELASYTQGPLKKISEPSQYRRLSKAEPVGPDGNGWGFMLRTSLEPIEQSLLKGDDREPHYKEVTRLILKNLFLL